MQRTFAIIKPDAVRTQVTGRILSRIESEGFAVRAMRMIHMSKAEAEGFYYVHLEAEDAIKKWRDLMGATDPAKATEGTLRKEFGASIDNNATHGSDAPETAAFELGYFFRGMELR